MIMQLRANLVQLIPTSNQIHLSICNSGHPVLLMYAQPASSMVSVVASSPSYGGMETTYFLATGVHDISTVCRVNGDLWGWSRGPSVSR